MARKGKKKPSNNKTNKAASSWDSLPRDMLETVFKNLSTGDRVRMGAVCKHWNHVASEAKTNIPQIPEAPWEILPEDSYVSPETFITQVRLKSLSESRIYRFKLPDNHAQGWLCGSSRGWLLVACGDKLDPDLVLWNPVKGLTRNLPSLSTHPLYEGFAKSIQQGDIDNVSCLFHRLQVFPVAHDSLGWAVAAIIFNKLGHYTNRISFCTPQGERWITYEEHPKYYVDIMFHEKKDTLFVLIHTTTDDSSKSIEDGLLLPKAAHLSAGCTVRLSFILISVQPVINMSISQENRDTCYTFERAKRVWRLVEDTLIFHDDGPGAIVVGTQLDCVRRDRANREMTVRFSTRHVSLVSEEVTSIGNQTIFLGSTSTNPIIVSGPLEGIEAGCVYLATDDSMGCCSDDEQYSIRENGIYFLKDRQMRRSSRTFARYPPPGKIGWLEPKLN